MTPLLLWGWSGSIPDTDTVKTRKRLGLLLFVTTVVAWCSIALAPTGVAVAQEECTERVPWLAFVDGAGADRSSGEMETSPGWQVPTTVGAGGATALGLGTAVAWTAGSVSAFFAASMLTCGALDVEIGGYSIGGFLDAIVGNSMQIGPPPVEHENIAVFNAPCTADADTSLGGFNGIAASAAWPGSSIAGACRYIRMSGFSAGRASTQSVTGTSGRHVIADNVERTVGGNVLPEKVGGTQYPVEFESAVAAMCRNGTLAGRCNSTTTSAGYNTAGAWDPRALVGTYMVGYGSEPANARTWINSQTATERLLVGCPETANVGGVCGVTPGRLFAVVNGAVPEIEAVFQPYPEAQTLGWKRRYVVDIRCHNNTTATWRRVESDLWWDATLNQRIPVPACPTGQLLTQYRIADVPQKITCAAASGAGCDAEWLLETWSAPSTWTATSTAPDWTACLTVGNECGEPAMVEGVCMMGAYTVAEGFCDPDEMTDAGAIPQTGTLTVNPEPVTDAPVSTLDPVVDPDDPPGTGTTIEVPIDEGDGRRCTADQTEACFGPVTEGHGEECFPNGWGWFNPAEWVLRPIKCAFIWAFKPGPGVGDAFDEFKDALFAQFPFSMVAGAADFLGTLGDSMDSAAGTGCWGGSASWSFGEYGTVAAEDVCIGDDVTVTTPQRQRVLVLMLAPMVWGLLRYTWAVVLGGNRQEATT